MYPARFPSAKCRIVGQEPNPHEREAGISWKWFYKRNLGYAAPQPSGFDGPEAVSSARHRISKLGSCVLVSFRHAAFGRQLQPRN